MGLGGANRERYVVTENQLTPGVAERHVFFRPAAFMVFQLSAFDTLRRI